MRRWLLLLLRRWLLLLLRWWLLLLLRRRLGLLRLWGLLPLLLPLRRLLCPSQHVVWRLRVWIQSHRWLPHRRVRPLGPRMHPTVLQVHNRRM